MLEPIYGVLLPLGVFGLETIALAIWLHRTAEPTKQNKKGKTNGR